MNGYCGLCRVAPRSITAHLGTATHRRATRARNTSGRRSIRPTGTWARALTRDPLEDVDAAALAAAEEWARGDTL